MQKENYYVFILVMLIVPLQFIDAVIRFDPKELLDLHNHCRKLHRSGELKLDSEISALAMEVALNVANNTPFDIEKYGMNAYWINDENLLSIGEVTAKTVFDYWYSEVNNYDYENESLNNMTTIKKFTQIVWKKTKRIGIAITHANMRTVVVALYSPKGNKTLKFKYNVLKPRNA